MSSVDDRLIDEKAAADRLGVKPGTLSAWRKRGRGPRYVKMGTGKTAAIRYRRADLDAWIEANVRTSTSDTGEVG